jgi:hypothetical protein
MFLLSFQQIATEGSRGQSVGFLSLSMVVGSLLAVLTFYALEVGCMRALES